MQQRFWLTRLIMTFSTLSSAAFAITAAADQPPPWAQRTADLLIARHPQATTIESGVPRWSYSPSFAVYAVAQVGLRGARDERYLDYARQYMSAFVDADGRIVTPTYNAAT